MFQPDGITPVGPESKLLWVAGLSRTPRWQPSRTAPIHSRKCLPPAIYSLTATDPATGNSSVPRIAVELNKDCVTDLRLLGPRLDPGAGGRCGGSGGRKRDSKGYGSRLPELLGPGRTDCRKRRVLLFENLPEGPYSITASRQGLSGRVSAIVSLSGLTTVTVQLQPAGSITGRVLMPDGTTPVGLADVMLVIDGRTVGYTWSSDDGAGQFLFSEVPVGDFKLEAYDNRSTRVGRTAGRIVQNNETVTADIVLISIGTVRGQVTSNSLPVDHAYVTLQSGEYSFFFTALKATTDATGNYQFPGVPAGKFAVSVKHPISG